MNEKILNRSISWMFAALLLILSFIRGPIQAWMLAAVFAAWVIYLAARLLLFEEGHARGPFPPEELARIFPPHGGTAAQA